MKLAISSKFNDSEKQQDIEEYSDEGKLSSMEFAKET